MNKAVLIGSIFLMAVAGPSTAQREGVIFYLLNPGPPDWIFDIHRVEADGGNDTKLTAGYPVKPIIGPSAFNISWTPDGSRITVNHRDPVSNRQDIFVGNGDWTDLVNLTNDRALDHCPSWSPDGTRIAFASLRGALSDIYVMNADGSDLTQLTDDPATDTYPMWSPDGSKIAFISGRDDNEELYVMNADGSGQVRLTDSEESKQSPAWSPDGTRIAYAVHGGDGRPFQIRAIGADGAGLVDLTDATSSWKDSPAWSPDGSQIAFTGEREDGSGLDIFTMDADGTNVVQLTHGEGQTLRIRPIWLPADEALSTIIKASSWGQVKAQSR